MDRIPSATTPRPQRAVLALLLLCLLVIVNKATAQDIFGEANKAPADRTRLAVAHFKPNATSGQSDLLRATFDTTLYNDLQNAGIFDMVSRSIAPPATPGVPAEISLSQWSVAPVSAAMVTFGSVSVIGSKFAVNGFLFDVKNPQYPQVLARQYNEDASEDSARQVAHRFADEIISRLGGGIAGIAETKIYYVHKQGVSKEIWEMDYDGANQHQITHLNTVSLSPRVSPDNSQLAFTSLVEGQGFKIKIYSLLLGRMLSFTTGNGPSTSPAWNPNGKELAYSASPNGDPDIWVSDVTRQLGRRLTSFPGPDSSPVYNPRTGGQIAWISGRKTPENPVNGLPQLYIMEADGSSVQRLTDTGYVSAPSWSPNGQFIAFGWNRKYGPGAPGGQDIYLMEIATKKWIQLTHDSGQCDFPSWSPDGRHIVYANSRNGRIEDMHIWTMLVDGTEKKELTTGGGNDMPNWSWK